MLTETEVKKIAKLARIEVSDNEIEKLKGELSSILDFVKKLGEADTNNIEPIYQTTGLVNSFRSDESRTSALCTIIYQDEPCFALDMPTMSSRATCWHLLASRKVAK